MKLVWRWLITAAAVWVAAYVVPGVDIEGGWFDLLIVALVFGLVNAFVRPVVRLLTLPLTVLTLGLFTLVVNGLMVLITTWFSETLILEGGFLERLFTGTLAAIVISLVSMVLSWFVGGKSKD